MESVVSLLIPAVTIAAVWGIYYQRKQIPPTSILLLVLTVLLCSIAQLQQTPPPFPLPTNTGDPPFEYHTATIDPNHVFSDTYQEARAKFRRATHSIPGAQLHSLSIPVPPEQSLLLDDEYTIDICIIPGQGAGWVVHTSGVHGVEGYAGSPIQIAFLESLYPLYKGHMKELLPTIILVHAVNPYGMAHYRRTNENNVDLNRNAMTPDEWKTTITTGPTGIYNHYENLTSWLNPTGPPNRLFALVTSWLQALPKLLLHGYDALKAALVTGQYYNPKGIFFGGHELQPSWNLLYEFLQQQQQTRPITGFVTWIDVHTGLGPSGVDTILVREHDEIEMRRWFPDARLPHTSTTARDVFQGYDRVKGLSEDLFRTLFDDKQQQQRPILMAQEFGTVPGILVAHALIVENRAYQYLPIQSALEWARQTTKRAFYPQTPTWRRRVLERGTQLLLQAIQRSSDMRTTPVRRRQQDQDVVPSKTTNDQSDEL